MRIGECELIFREENGAIKYRCKNPRHYHDGTVPHDVCAEGEEAIRRYIVSEYEKLEAKRKRYAEFGANPNVEIAARHNDADLKGRIVRASSRFIMVRLESPERYAGEHSINYGMASAMSGHHVFKGGEYPEFSEDALATARDLLVRIYLEKRHAEDHKDAIELAERLNRDK